MVSTQLPCGSSWIAMCDHPSWREVYAGLLARCTRCGLVATARRPDFTYRTGYFTGDEGGGYDFDSPFAQAYDDARFGDELDRLERQGLHGSVLDIGCAVGRFLQAAQSRGWRVSGVEVADFAREQASSRLGIDVVASLEGLPPGSRYDVVTLHHVLEHVHDPLPFLREAVAPRVGRRLLVEVPNFASLASRANGAQWQDLRPEQHVCHYDSSTIAHLARAAGFRIVRVYTLSTPLWTLRTATQLLGSLPALLLKRPSGEQAAAAAALSGSIGYRQPRGARFLAARASYVALRPLVRALEAGGLGERLVLEAAPGEVG